MTNTFNPLKFVVITAVKSAARVKNRSTFINFVKLSLKIGIYSEFMVLHTLGNIQIQAVYLQISREISRGN